MLHPTMVCAILGIISLQKSTNFPGAPPQTPQQVSFRDRKKYFWILVREKNVFGRKYTPLQITELKDLRSQYCYRFITDTYITILHYHYNCNYYLMIQVLFLVLSIQNHQCNFLLYLKLK